MVSEGKQKRLGVEGQRKTKSIPPARHRGVRSVKGHRSAKKSPGGSRVVYFADQASTHGGGNTSGSNSKIRQPVIKVTPVRHDQSKSLKAHKHGKKRSGKSVSEKVHNTRYRSKRKVEFLAPATRKLRSAYTPPPAPHNTNEVFMTARELNSMTEKGIGCVPDDASDIDMQFSSFCNWDGESLFEEPMG